jgi:hypothetical protein
LDSDDEEEKEEFYFNQHEFYWELMDIEEQARKEEIIRATTAWLDEKLFGPDSKMKESEEGDNTLALIAYIEAGLAETPVKATTSEEESIRATTAWLDEKLFGPDSDAEDSEDEEEHSDEEDGAQDEEDEEMGDSEEEDSPAFASPAAKKRRRDQEESDEEEVQRALALAKRPKLQPTTPARQLVSSLAETPGRIIDSAKAFKGRVAAKAKRIAERARGTAATARRRMMNPTEQDLAQMALELEAWKDTYRSMRGYLRI